MSENGRRGQPAEGPPLTQTTAFTRVPYGSCSMNQGLRLGFLEVRGRAVIMGGRQAFTPVSIAPLVLPVAAVGYGF